MHAKGLGNRYVVPLLSEQSGFLYHSQTSFIVTIPSNNFRKYRHHSFDLQCLLDNGAFKCTALLTSTEQQRLAWMTTFVTSGPRYHPYFSTLCLTLRALDTIHPVVQLWTCQM